MLDVPGEIDLVAQSGMVSPLHVLSKNRNLAKPLHLHQVLGAHAAERSVGDMSWTNHRLRSSEGGLGHMKRNLFRPNTYRYLASVRHGALHRNPKFVPGGRNRNHFGTGPGYRSDKKV